MYVQWFRISEKLRFILGYVAPSDLITRY